MTSGKKLRLIQREHDRLSEKLFEYAKNWRDKAQTPGMSRQEKEILIVRSSDYYHIAECLKQGLL